MSRRPSAQTMAVLSALTTDATSWRHGYDLGREIGLKAGSLYPILMRLNDRGLLESAWERESPSGRPPRHLYRLTAEGRAYAKEHASATAGQREGRESSRSSDTMSPRLATGDAR